MRKSLHALLAVLAAGVMFGACAMPTRTAVGVLPSPTVITTQAMPAPEEMPTAAPLWTATPEVAPSSTAGQSPAIQATPSARQEPEALDASIVAVVNGTVITRESYEQQVAQAQTYLLQQPGQDARSEASRQALQQLREQEIGRASCRERG